MDFLSSNLYHSSALDPIRIPTVRGKELVSSTIIDHGGWLPAIIWDVDFLLMGPPQTYRPRNRGRASFYRREAISRQECDDDGG